MALVKTSVQLDGAERDRLLAMYPGISVSVIIRLAIRFMLEKQPEIQLTPTFFETKDRN